MLKVTCRKFSILLGALLALGGSAFAQAVDGAEVMDRYYHAAKPKTQIMSMTMSISKGGSTLTRSMATWTQGDNAKGEVEQKVIKFSAPGDIKGSGFLTAKKVDGSKESQLWLPAMGRPSSWMRCFSAFPWKPGRGLPFWASPRSSPSSSTASRRPSAFPR